MSDVMMPIDPHTGAALDPVPATSADTLPERLDRAWRAFEGWRSVPLDERVAVLARAAEVLAERRDALAATMTAEMGKRVAEARAEVDKCAWVCRHYAEHAAAYLADVPVATEARDSRICHLPLGPVLAVMPWNFPLWQVFRFAAPALAAGNTCLLKHASNVPGCARAIEAVWHGAGLDPDLFQALLVPSSAVAGLIAHPAVRAVTLTGSTPAGRAVAAAAGAELKKTVLELGGSDPYVVLADADLDRAADACVASRMANAGQSCIAAKRVVVVDAVADDLVARLRERLAPFVPGDPRREDTRLAPMARVDLRAELHDQVQRSVTVGARLVLGGQIPDGPGAHYPATLLDHVAPGMPAHDEELFGPVVAVERARDEADALRLADATPFGLGAAVFTADVERGAAIARDQLHAGCCFVNDFVRSDPRLPFGGIAHSGYGRELGRAGILEFVNRKTLWVA